MTLLCVAILAVLFLAASGQQAAYAEVVLGDRSIVAASVPESEFVFATIIPDNGNELFVVSVALNADVAVTSMTFDGDALTRVLFVNSLGARSETWLLVGHGGMTADLVINLSSSEQPVLGFTFFSGVDQATPVSGTTLTSSSDGNTASIPVDGSAVGNLVYNWLTLNGEWDTENVRDIVAVPPNTPLGQGATSTDVIGASGWIPGSASTVTVQWNWTVVTPPVPFILTAIDIVAALNHPPTADAGPDQDVVVGQLVTLDGNGSSDPDLDPLSYEWDFDDGSPAGVGAVVTHAYAAAGVYNVELEVGDGNGLIATDIAVITVRTPEEATDDLITDVESLPIAHGLKNALLAKLNAALSSLDAGRPRAAMGQLQAFKNQVESKRGTDLTDAEADALIAECDAIMDAITDAAAAASAAQAAGDHEIGIVLYQNVPNPFNPVTMIQYDVPQPGGQVSLNVYDVLGKLVRTLVRGHQTPGLKAITWDSRNDRGQIVPTGVYFYRVQAKGVSETRKMVIMK